MLVVWLKKKNYDTKISEPEEKLTDHIHDKYITTPESQSKSNDTRIYQNIKRILEYKFGYQNKSKIQWKLFKVRQNYACSWKNSKHLHSL